MDGEVIVKMIKDPDCMTEDEYNKYLETLDDDDPAKYLPPPPGVIIPDRNVLLSKSAARLCPEVSLETLDDDNCTKKEEVDEVTEVIDEVADKGVSVLADLLSTFKLDLQLEKDGLEEQIKRILKGGKRLDNPLFSRKQKTGQCSIYRTITGTPVKRKGKQWMDSEWTLKKTWWNYGERSYYIEWNPYKAKQELKWEHTWYITALR